MLVDEFFQIDNQSIFCSSNLATQRNFECILQQNVNDT